MKPIKLLSNLDLYAEYERATKSGIDQKHEYSFHEIQAEINRRFAERMEIRRRFQILKDL